VAQKSAFGCDREAGRIGIQGLSDQFFADVWSVGIGRIDKVDAGCNGVTQHVLGNFAIGRRTPNALAGNAHRTEAEAVDR